MLDEFLNKRIENLEKLKSQKSAVLQASDILKAAIEKGSKIFFCGNGGSAADSNHLACEFIARFKKERKSYPAISLCANQSIITAIANDYSFNEVFKRQLEGLASKNDVLIAISTSAESQNVLEAVKFAKENNIKTIFLTGENKETEADCTICAPSSETAQIQEMHILIGHILCELTEKEIAAK